MNRLSKWWQFNLSPTCLVGLWCKAELLAIFFIDLSIACGDMCFELKRIFLKVSPISQVSLLRLFGQDRLNRFRIAILSPEMSCWLNHQAPAYMYTALLVGTAGSLDRIQSWQILQDSRFAEWMHWLLARKGYHQLGAKIKLMKEVNLRYQVNR